MAAQPDVESVVRSKFTVKDSFQLPDGEVEYKVEYRDDTKAAFVELHAKLASMGMTPTLIGTKEDAALIVRKKEPMGPIRSRLPALLALLTVASIVVFSIFERIGYEAFAPGAPGNFVFLTYGVTVIAVLGAHRLGHFYMSRRSRTEPPTGYFIPGIPDVTAFLPALGEVSRQREPAANRDKLFDVMLSGPLFAFALSVVLYIAGGFLSVQSATQIQGCQLVGGIQYCPANASLLQSFLDWLTSPVAPGVASGFARFSPLQDGASIGFLLTFIGLLPMASFDGGHMFSVLWGQRAIRLATYLSVFLLIAIDTPNYWAVAILALLLAGRPPESQVLDEVSGVARSRKWIWLGAIALAFLSLPVPQNLGFLPLS